MLFAANGGATPPPLAPAPRRSRIIVTGSRVATTATTWLPTSRCCQREDFDGEKPRQLADILRRVAGVHIDQVGGRGGTGSLYLRGADPNYTLVLVDGVRVNDPTNARGGSFDFSNFDVADIERVEIARGPYSAVYGGDALAGVVNIVTRRAAPEKTRASLDAMGGSYDVREISFDASGPLGAHAWNFGASDSREGEVTRGNEFDGQRVSGGLDFALGASTRAFVSGRYSETSREGFPDDSGGYEFADIRTTEQARCRRGRVRCGLQHRRRRRHLRAAAGLLRPRRPHRFTGRGAGNPRSLWRAAQRGRHRSHALFRHLHGHAEILRSSLRRLWRRLAA
jgi:outer membrane receptor protein involved in Fe transport